MRDVIVVGGGPAGLTAGMYAARAGYDVLLLEKNIVGGQIALTSRMENYPGFAEGIDAVELCMAMEAQAVRFGARVAYEAALEIDVVGKRVRTAAGWLPAAHLILALGAQPRRLSVPGEESFIGRGISFCAICDGALYRGKRVAVIGGGRSAVEDALYLAGIGCECFLIHRRDTLRAEQVTGQRLLELPNVTPLWNSAVASFEGDRRLTGLTLASGERLAVDAAFIAIGRVPDTEIVRGQIALDPQGFIIAGEDCRTSFPGIFAVGDARTKAIRQVTTAVADGTVAASGLGPRVG